MTLITYLAKLFKYELGVGIRSGVILGQAGEFSLVILSIRTRAKPYIGASILQIMLSVCLLSMLFGFLYYSI